MDRVNSLTLHTTPKQPRCDLRTKNSVHDRRRVRRGEKGMVCERRVTDSLDQWWNTPRGDRYLGGDHIGSISTEIRKREEVGNRSLHRTLGWDGHTVLPFKRVTKSFCLSVWSCFRDTREQLTLCRYRYTLQTLTPSVDPWYSCRLTTVLVVRLPPVSLFHPF